MTVGAFYLMSDKEVHWRPREYWQPGTKVAINAAIYGKDFGNGVFGKQDRNAAITIGNSVVAIADGQTHQMTVSINGGVARTIPISMGKRGHETGRGQRTQLLLHRLAAHRQLAREVGGARLPPRSQ